MVDALGGGLAQDLFHFGGVHFAELVLRDVHAETAHSPTAQSLQVPRPVVHSFVHVLPKRNGDGLAGLVPGTLAKVLFQTREVVGVLGVDLIVADGDLEVGRSPLGDAALGVTAFKVVSDRLVHFTLNHIEYHALEFPAFQYLLPQFVERPPLKVHYLVVIEQVLAYLEVAFLDLSLRAGDALGDASVFDGDVALQTQPAQHFKRPLPCEDGH